MFDLGWTELLLIGIVALIVVGPKDLPGLFRTVGKFVGKARGMAREFSRAMNDAADQSGMSEIRKTIKTASNPVKSALDEVRKTTDTVARDINEATKTAVTEPALPESADKKTTVVPDEKATAKKQGRTPKATTKTASPRPAPKPEVEGQK